MGARDKRIPVLEVLRLAAIFRKRPLGDVAADLVSHARAADPRSVGAIEAQLAAEIELLTARLARERTFLAEARRALPRPLYREVERVYRARRDDAR